VTLGLFVAPLGRTFGITEETVSNAAAVLMIGFGFVLLVPRLSAKFATATVGVSTQADSGMDHIDRDGLTGQFTAGVLLGAVWSPCIGPTLGGAISLASQGESLVRAEAIIVTFALGVSTVILALGYGPKSVIRKRQDVMRRFAVAARPVMGPALAKTGAAYTPGLVKKELAAGKAVLWISTPIGVRLAAVRKSPSKRFWPKIPIIWQTSTSFPSIGMCTPIRALRNRSTFHAARHWWFCEATKNWAAL